jgi:sugar phosphate isomerase/epimerase
MEKKMVLSNLGISTSSYEGHQLDIVLENIAALGFKMVEIAAVTGWTEHVIPEKMTLKDFKRVEHLLQSNKLECHSFSGHVDLGKDDSIDRFKRRIDFAEHIGAPIINTFTTAYENIDLFFKNMDVLINYTSKKGIKIGLETHGDLIDKDTESIEIVRKIGSNIVGINYDPGNAVFFNRNNISIVDELSLIFNSGYLLHIHYKDVLFGEKNEVTFPGLGKGILDWPGLIKQLKTLGYNGPMSLELELNLRGTFDKIYFDSPIPIDEINNELIRSLKYLEELYQKS